MSVVVPHGRQHADGGAALSQVTTRELLANDLVSIAPGLVMLQHEGSRFLADVSGLPVEALAVGQPDIALAALPITDFQAGFLLARAKGPQ